MRMAYAVKPRLVIKTGCLDDQIVSIPSANRIPQPGGVEILGKCSSIHPDFANRVKLFEVHQNSAGNLNHLKRMNTPVESRDADWIAMQNRVRIRGVFNKWTITNLILGSLRIEFGRR